MFYVRVKGKDDDELSADAGEQDRTKARIIVDSFETIPAEIYAGQPFVVCFAGHDTCASDFEDLIRHSRADLFEACNK